jgi:hypothetical protein
VKKAMMGLWVFFFMAAFWGCGKVPEGTGPVGNIPGASVEASQALKTNSEIASKDEAPIDEELKDEEVVDSDA